MGSVPELRAPWRSAAEFRGPSQTTPARPAPGQRRGDRPARRSGEAGDPRFRHGRRARPVHQPLQHRQRTGTDRVGRPGVVHDRAPCGLRRGGTVRRDRARPHRVEPRLALLRNAVSLISTLARSAPGSGGCASTRGAVLRSERTHRVRLCQSRWRPASISGRRQGQRRGTAVRARFPRLTGGPGGVLPRGLCPVPLAGGLRHTRRSRLRDAGRRRLRASRGIPRPRLRG